jgi:hypothetical protein
MCGLRRREEPLRRAVGEDGEVAVVREGGPEPVGGCTASAPGGDSPASYACLAFLKRAPRLLRREEDGDLLLLPCPRLLPGLLALTSSL